MSNEIRILTEFKKSLITFFDELITQFPQEGDLVIARIFLDSQIPIEDIMKNFILKMSMGDGLLKNMVKDKQYTSVLLIYK